MQDVNNRGNYVREKEVYGNFLYFILSFSKTNFK